jgi:phage shock protein A
MFRRLGNLVRGFFSIFVSGLERQNPEALLAVEQENLRKQVGKFNTSLAAHAGLVERLIAQVRKLEGDQADLRAKTAANLKLGNREIAGNYALRLQTVERELTENRKQMEQAETTYRELVRARDVAVGVAKSKIEALKSGISDLKMKRAMAEITEMASGMVTELGGSGDTLNRLEEMVGEERHKAAGRVRVAVDSLDLNEFHTGEAERNALAEQALAAFEVKETEVIGAGSETGIASRSIPPAIVLSEPRNRK